MATSGFWQRLSATASREWAEGPDSVSVRGFRGLRGKATLWMFLDALTVLGAAVLATLYERHTTPVIGARRFVHGALFQHRSMGILLALVCGFTVTLIIISRRLQLYSPL